MMTSSPLPHQSNVVTEMAWADFLHWAVGDPELRRHSKLTREFRWHQPPLRSNRWSMRPPARPKAECANSSVGPLSAISGSSSSQRMLAR